MREHLVADSLLNEAETLAPIYAEAKQAFDAASAELEEVTENYQQWQEDIDHTEEDYSQSSSSISDIHIRGWSMAVAIALGVLAVVSLLGLVPVRSSDGVYAIRILRAGGCLSHCDVYGKHTDAGHAADGF